MRYQSFAVALCVTVAVSACSNKKPLPPLPPATHAAAVELGFAAGSLDAQAAQPMDLRQNSSLGFARSEADLVGFMDRLQLPAADAANIATGMLEGFADPNPARGGQLMSDAMNLLMSRLQASPYPELLWSFKVGFSVGHMGETINVLTKGTPQPEHVQVFAAQTTRDRATLQGDLDQSGMPADLYDAIQAVNIEIRSVSDLFAITRACLKIKGMVGQMR